MPDKKTAGRAPKAGKAERVETPAAPRRRPKTKEPEAAAAEPQSGRLRVKQVRSGIGHAFTYRRTLVALGLRHHQAEIVVPDTPSVRGMLVKVAHLVRVRPEEK
ncbi:MAG TPA: 50S ribosomal protein L30 [Gemmatimonadales bacterium]